MAVSSEFGCVLIFQYLDVGVECYQWRMAKSVGCHSNMNIFPIFVIGVDVWITPIGIVRDGLKAMEH